MIQIQDLTKSYGDIQAIKSLSFEVNKGEVVGFLGPNGAGKSTTMRIITGHMAPTEGKVSVAGFDVFENPLEVKRRIGYLPETPPIYGEMRVRSYLIYVSQLKDVPSGQIQKNVADAIQAAGLESVKNRLIQNLSKGYKQRVGIAQALVSKPEILILDEPTVGLDPKQVTEIRKLIQSLKGKHTIILSTHILSEVQANCERIIIIDNGTIVAQDTLVELNQRIQGGGGIVIVRVRHFKPELENSLLALEGVNSVEGNVNESIFRISISGSEEVQERIADEVARSGVGLVEIKTELMTLEEIFLKIIAGDKPL